MKPSRFIAIICIIILALLWYAAKNRQPLQEPSLPGSVHERDLQRKSDVRTIITLLQEYSRDHNGYFPQSNERVIIINSSNNLVFSALVPKYAASLPQDPKLSKDYRYHSSGSEHFFVSAHLENYDDPECYINDKNYCVYRMNEKGEVITRKVK